MTISHLRALDLGGGLVVVLESGEPCDTGLPVLPVLMGCRKSTIPPVRLRLRKRGSRRDEGRSGQSVNGITGLPVPGRCFVFMITSRSDFLA